MRDLRGEVHRPVEVREVRQDGAAAVEEARRARKNADRRKQFGIEAVLGGGWEVWGVGEPEIKLLEPLVRGEEVEEGGAVGADLYRRGIRAVNMLSQSTELGMEDLKLRE